MIKSHKTPIPKAIKQIIWNKYLGEKMELVCVSVVILQQLLK